MENPSSTPKDLAQIAKQLDLPTASVQATVELLDEGNTVPFITRYRKDMTGGLDEQQIRHIQDAITRLRQLNERKQKIIKSIRAQDKLTEKIESKINAATTLKALEDLYLPYKAKKQTLATIARQKGLEPLAKEVFLANPIAVDFEQRCLAFVDPAKELITTSEVETGVRHLLTEYYSELVDLRSLVRRHMWRGQLVSKRIENTQEATATEASDGPADSVAGKTKSDKHESASRETAPSETKNQIDDSVESEVDQTGLAAPTTQSSPTTESASSDVATESASTSKDSESQKPGPSHEGTESVATATDSQLPVADDSTSEPVSEGAENASTGEPAQSTDASQDDAAGVAPKTESIAPESTTEGSPTPRTASDVSTQAAESESAATTTESIPAARSKTSGKTAAQTKAELSKQRREMRREARRRKRQKLEQSFKDYFSFSESIKRLPHHRTLALNRGERSKVLRVKIEFDFDALRTEAEQKIVADSHPHADLLRECLVDALTRSVISSIEREIRRDLTDKAESHAVEVFARNLRKLLLQAPLRGHRVLAIDPGFKSGCKLVALDEFGNVLAHSLIHVIGSSQRVEESRYRIAGEIKHHKLSVVAIGNGTACRETEQMVAQILTENLADMEIGYVIVNEAGASVYSTSPIGREELPKFDATVRGGVSIGRRTLDPLSELVKIDPANIGVGLYQHDVKAKHLRKSLDAVVESCVNYVGVDVNSASPALLGYVSGLNQLTARRVYEYRLENGPFKSREELKQVPGIGEATYVQAAGFLKISDGDNPLDGTWIHPESYEVVEKVLSAIGCNVDELRPARWTEPNSHDESNVEEKPVPTMIEAENQPAPAAEDSSSTDHATESPAPTATQDSVTTSAVSTQDSAGSPTNDADTAPPSVATEEVATTSDSDPSVNDEQKLKATEEPAQDSQEGIETMAQAPSPSSISTEHNANQPTPIVDVTPPNSLATKLAAVEVEKLAGELGVGRMLLEDILSSLARPGRDPREDLSPPIFRREVMKLEHLKAGMELTGTVLNVVDFGAFVDIGLSDCGLIHVSRLSDQFVSDPHDIVSVGDILTVWVIEVDEKRRRVSLTAIKPGTETETPPRRQKPKREKSEGHSDRPRSKGRERRPRQGSKARQHQRPRKTGWQSKAKPKPVVPITDEMATGKEPMRTFGDLQQFFEQQKTSNETAESSEGEQDSSSADDAS